MRTDEEVIEQINVLIANQIQPSVAMHGGVVTLHSFKDGVATMFMSGACSGCGCVSYFSWFTITAGWNLL